MTKAIRGGFGSAYVVALPRTALVPCREVVGWPAGTTLIPLIDTRLSAVVRRGCASAHRRARRRPPPGGRAVSFRARLFLATSVAVLVPLTVLALGVRREMGRRLDQESRRRGGAAVQALGTELARERERVVGRLVALVKDLSADNRFRLAAVQGEAASRTSPPRLGRRRHAALRPVSAPGPGQQRTDPELRPLPKRVRPAAARPAGLPARHRRCSVAGPGAHRGIAAARTGRRGAVRRGRPAVRPGRRDRGRGPVSPAAGSGPRSLGGAGHARFHRCARCRLPGGRIHLPAVSRRPGRVGDRHRAPGRDQHSGTLAASGGGSTPGFSALPSRSRRCSRWRSPPGSRGW